MLSCYLIGEDHLLIQCAALLLENNFNILGIISPLPEAKNWASSYSIPYFSSLDNAENTLLRTNFDYLFSIINSQILSESILQRAQKLNINYHNAPLPKYAGVNANNWAILNNEKIYGITWHIIEKKVDSGDILKQAFFDVSNDETALSLNAKCYQHAIRLFQELAKELKQGNYQLIAQDMSQRTYYSQNKKPLGNGWVDWKRASEDIERMFKGLLFQYANPLSILKFKIRNEAFIITQLKCLPHSSTQAPGTLVELSKDQWSIATQTHDIAVLAVRSVENQAYTLQELAEHYYLHEGYQFTSPSLQEQETFSALSESYFKYEKYWVTEYEKLTPPDFPFIHAAQAKTQLTPAFFECITTLELPENILTAFQNTYKNSIENLLISTWILYLYRITNQQQISIEVNIPSSTSTSDFPENFFSHFTPLSITLHHTIKFEQILNQVESFNNISFNKPFLRDIFYRYPALAGISQNRSFATIIEQDSAPTSSLSHPNALLIFKIFKNGKKLSWLVDKNCLVKEPFLKPVINNIAGHFQELIANMLAVPRLPINEYAFLTAKEKHTLIYEWNKTQQDYPSDKTICQLFERQVETAPENTALSYENNTLTYFELNKKSNQLARYLLTQGIKSDSLVLVYLERGIELIITILGIWKAGATYIPMATNFPAEHVRSVINDSQVSFVITTENLSKNIISIPYNNDDSPQYILIDTNRSSIEKSDITNPHYAASSDHLAYIIYTSGTTGKPKGVMVKHNSLTNLVYYAINKLNINSSCHTLQFSSITFDASIWEIFITLIGGGTLHIPNKKYLLAGYGLAKLINHYQITFITLPPSVLQTISQYELPSIKTIVTAGEPCSQELAQDWSKSLRFINAYGPTEATICTTLEEVPCSLTASPSIGKPINNVATYVLDNNLNPVPVGVIGELYISGENIALGYLKKEELTNQYFLPNPFLPTPIKMYKTRDLVRWLPDGKLDYIGRLDHQIKIRGYRVELEAIETQILHFPNVSECVVVVRQDKSRGKYLVAYITTKTPPLEIQALHNFLRNILPDYMIPAFFIAIDKLPLTPHGKIDRQKLPIIDTSKRITMEEYSLPQTYLEKKLAKIWGELLGLECIGTNDNFFSLGGHSLLISRLILKLVEEFNYHLSFQDFFQIPTIAHLAKLISHKDLHLQSPDLLIASDKILSPSIFPSNNKYAVKHPLSILITGAAGFLGIHLLYELHKITDANFYCLIRCGSAEEGLEKLKLAISQYKLDWDFFERIKILPGDLEQPKLGLHESEYDFLAEEIDIIYHSGANVHHLYDYNNLRASNVLGTIELLKLTTHTKNKKFIYVSTLSSIFDYLNDRNEIIENFINENIPLPVLDGYNTTKRVCEILLAQAHARGINVHIYRPGLILGHSQLGILHAEKIHILLLIKGCIQMGYACNWDLLLNILPVDFISKFLAQTSLCTGISTKVFNLANPSSITWKEVITLLNEAGYNIKFLSYEGWEKKLLEIKEDNLIFKLLPLYMNEQNITNNKMSYCQVSTKYTQNALVNTSLSWPLSSKALFKKYISQLDYKELSSSKAD